MSCTIVIIINNGYISFISKKKKKSGQKNLWNIIKFKKLIIN